MSLRNALKRDSPHAVSADRPTLNPSSRTTITSAAAEPRLSSGAPSITAELVGATVSPKPVPSIASSKAMIP
jgi:hypothetical protein